MHTTYDRDNKHTRTARFFESLAKLGLSYSEADTLRLAEKRLHRWAELECGDGNDHASWGIERDADSFMICSQCGVTSYVPAEVAATGNCPKCGDCAPIKRHVATGKPYMVTHPHNGPSRRHRIADREAGALKRIGAVIASHPGLWFFHQSDPRGCALYVGRLSDIPEGAKLDSCYTSGIACCID